MKRDDLREACIMDILTVEDGGVNVRVLILEFRPVISEVAVYVPPSVFRALEEGEGWRVSEMVRDLALDAALDAGGDE